MCLWMAFFCCRRKVIVLPRDNPFSASAVAKGLTHYTLPAKCVPTGCSSPLLETQGQRNRHPFGIPARFEMSTHKWKKVRGHSFQNAKIPQASLYQRGKPAGFSLLNYFSSGLLRSNPRINFRSGSTAEGVTDSSSSPIRRNVSVNVGSAPSSPQIPTQQPCRCPDSTVCRIIRRTAG